MGIVSELGELEYILQNGVLKAKLATALFLAWERKTNSSEKLATDSLQNHDVSKSLAIKLSKLSFKYIMGTLAAPLVHVQSFSCCINLLYEFAALLPYVCSEQRFADSGGVDLCSQSVPVLESISPNSEQCLRDGGPALDFVDARCEAFFLESPPIRFVVLGLGRIHGSSLLAYITSAFVNPFGLFICSMVGQLNRSQSASLTFLILRQFSSTCSKVVLVINLFLLWARSHTLNLIIYIKY